MKFVPAAAYHFCLKLPAIFLQLHKSFRTWYIYYVQGRAKMYLLNLVHCLPWSIGRRHSSSSITNCNIFRRGSSGFGLFGGPSSRRSGRRPPPRGRSAPTTPTDNRFPPERSFEEHDRSFDSQVLLPTPLNILIKERRKPQTQLSLEERFSRIV